MIAYLGLGSNLGNREILIDWAAERLGVKSKFISMSTYFHNPAWGVKNQPEFINTAVAIDTQLSPLELLADALEIENDLGRVRGIKNGPRRIDIDILLYGSLIINEPNLKIPHIGMHERLSVLYPLRQIAPNAVHPVLNKTIEELYHEVF